MHEKEKKSYEFGNWTLNDILNDPCEREELKGALFRIPDYQRGYAWGRRQLEEFWEDLLTLKRDAKSENEAESDSGKKGKSHYMGAITVERKKDENGKSVFEVVDGQQLPVYEVVDGQQRLTTIAILLSVLPDSQDSKGKDKDLCSRFSYGEPNENGYFKEILKAVFAAVVSEDEKTTFPKPSSLAAPKNIYQKNLVDAKSFFSEKVYKLDPCGPSAEDIKDWVVGDSEEGRLEFDFRILRQDHNAGIIFETMNNRGKPLTLLEKLKNRLMYLTEIATVEDESDDNENPIDANELRRTINEAWGNIYGALTYKRVGDFLGGDKFVSLDEDEFVAAHLSVYRLPKESVYSETVAESRLFKMFCEHPEEHPKSEEIDERQQDAVAGAEKEESLSLWKIERYVKDLSAFAPAWVGIHQEFASACGQCRLLSDRRETKIFLAAVALHVQDESLRANIYEDARQILFRNTIGAGMDRIRFATLARRLHGVCVDQLKRGQRKPLDGNGVLAELESVLDNGRKKPTKNTLIEFFADKQKGDFYGWSEVGMRYFLMRQEEDCRILDENTPRRLKWEMFENVSVEHVLPQSSANRNSRGWRWWSPLLCDWLRQTARKDNPIDAELEAAAKMLSGTLGNLTLLTREENSKVSALPWDTYPNKTGKRDFYLDSSNCSSNGAVALATDTPPQKWNATHIRNRGRKLFRQLAADFGVTEKLSDFEVDKALGFIDPNDANHQVYHLEDLEIPFLDPDIIAANVHMDEEEDQKAEWHRHWNSIPTDENKRVYFDLWTRFKNWCKDNGKTWCTRSVPQDGRPYYDPAASGSAPLIHLFFTVGARSGSITNEGPLVTTGIYCHEGDNQRAAIKKYKGDFDEAFADCPPDYQDWDYVCKGRKAKRILFIRKGNWTNSGATLFARMAADFEIVRKVLSNHNVNVMME